MSRSTQIAAFLKKSFVSRLRRQLPRRAIVDPRSGSTVGYVERARLCGRSLEIEGWIRDGDLRVSSGGEVTDLNATICRADVNQTFDLDPAAQTGFVARTLCFDEIVVSLRKEGTWHPVLTWPTLRFQDRLRAWVLLAGDLALLLYRRPSIFFEYLVHGQKEAGRQIDLEMNPRPRQEIHLFNDALLGETLSPVEAEAHCGPVSIIVPVYNALQSVKLCLQHIIEHTEGDYDLIVIEDCSSDVDVRPWLRTWVRQHQRNDNNANIILIENNANLGFPLSVNKGLDMSRGRHVVILNTDAFVPPGWLSRLIYPIAIDSRIASVTPMSNDAEIFSVPVICRSFALSPGHGNHIDAIASKLDRDACIVEAPTGVGFCMAMNKEFLRQERYFDVAFGRGYGEEVDWCQKIHRHGGRNVVTGNLFVQHLGGQSFGSDNKNASRDRNKRIIDQRYSSFDIHVQEFITADPLKSARILLALASIDSGDYVEIVLAHTWGGGAEHYLQDRVQRTISSGAGVVVIRDDEANAAYVLEVHTPAGMTSLHFASAETLVRVTRVIRRRKLLYSCMVGARDVVDFLRVLLDGFDSETDRIEVLVHDYFSVCISYNLINSTGRYCGLPDKESCEGCFSMLPHNGLKKPESMDAWRAPWRKLFAAAAVIRVFSATSQRLFMQAYPEFSHKLLNQPHELAHVPRQVVKKDVKGLRIGVLGGIGYSKGAEVVARLGRARALLGGEIIVIGKMDPRFATTEITVHGTYRREDVAELAEHYAISCWLIASIWPETFSFTTHEALATGLPVFCFDLGAQAEAVAVAANGCVLKAKPDETSAILNEIREEMAKRWREGSQDPARSEDRPA